MHGEIKEKEKISALDKIIHFEGKGMKRFVTIIGIIVIALLLFLNIVYIADIDVKENTFVRVYGIINTIISIIIGVGIITLCYFISKIKTNKIVRVLLIILALSIYIIAQLIWIHFSVSLPFYDSDTVYKSGEDIFMKRGDYTFHDYMDYYKQQIGTSVLFAMIFKLVSDAHQIYIQFANVFSNVMTVLGMYFILRIIHEKKDLSRPICFILSLTYIPIILMCTFVYGDFIGLALSVWATVFVMIYGKTDKIRYATFSSIWMGIALIARTNYNIYTIAIFLYLLFLLLKRNKTIKTIVLNAIVIIAWLVISLIPSKIVQNIVVERYHLDKKRQYTKSTYLYMGMSEGIMGAGWYNAEINQQMGGLVGKKLVPSEVETIYQEKTKERLLYLITHPIEMIEFYRDKLVTTWAEPTLEFEFYNAFYLYPDKRIEDNPLMMFTLSKPIYNGLKIYQKTLVFLLFFGALICVWKNRKKPNNEVLLLTLIFLGGFAFHFLWETKSRYIIPYLVILMPLASSGLAQFVEKIKQRRKKDVKDEESISSHTDVL